MNFKDKSLQYLTFALVFLTPLVFWSHRLYPHISSKTFFIYGAVEVIFFIWIYFLFTDRSYRLPKKIFLWFSPLFLFVIWMSISGIFAVDPSLALWSSFGRGTGLLTLYHSLAFALVVASLVKKNGIPYITSLFQSFLAGSFILATTVWLGSEGFNVAIKTLQTDGGGGLTGNSTLVAGYFLFILAMGGFLLTQKNISASRKWLIYSTMMLIIFSPVFANLYGFFAGKGILGSARGTILALFSGLGATGVSYMFFSFRKWIRGISVAFVILGLMIFSFLWIQLITPNTDLHRKFVEEARGTRFILWDVADIALSKRPFLGYGPENYFIAFEENFNPQVFLEQNSSEGWVDRAHNIYYDLGVSGGYPAIVFYFTFILSLFYAIFTLCKKEKLSRMQASILTGLIIAHIANHLFTFESNLSILSLFLLGGMIYSLLFNDLENKFLPLNIGKFNKNVLIFSLSVLFVLTATFFVYLPSVKSKAYAETFVSVINDRPMLYAKLLEGSFAGRSWDVSGLAYDVYKNYATNPAQLKNSPALLPYAIEDISALLSYLDKVAEVNKNDYRLYITMALLQNHLTYLTDKPYNEESKEKIFKILNHAKFLSPANPNVYWTIAQTKVWMGDFVGARGAYQDAMEVAPYLPHSYNLALRYAQIVGDQEFFNEIMVKAKEKIPGFVFK